MVSLERAFRAPHRRFFLLALTSYYFSLSDYFYCVFRWAPDRIFLVYETADYYYLVFSLPVPGT